MDHINIKKKNDYAVVYLDRGKVNAMNHAMVVEIRKTFDQLKNDTEVRGVIITGKPHYFSAGLDVIELYQYDADQIRAFWLDFLGMMIDLTKFNKPAIAAISGYSPAGGAIIALTCDYRLMAEGEKYLIGLNEVAVGISITNSIYSLYSFWLGDRKAYQALLTGKLFNVAEAKEVGLIDQIVELDDILEAAENKMQLMLRPNDYILGTTKSMMRQELIRQMDVDLTAQVDERCEYWMSPQSRKELGAFVEKLTQSKG